MKVVEVNLALQSVGCKNSKTWRCNLSASWLAIVLSAFLLISANKLYAQVRTLKAKTSSRVQLLIPSEKLATSLAVDSCSDQILASTYKSTQSYALAKSGLSIFKKRLADEYRISSNTFYNLVAGSQALPSQNPTCLLPLKVTVDKSIGVDIVNSNLIEVSLNSQSLFCSGEKAFIASNSKFYQVGNALNDYAGYLKVHKVEQSLKRNLLSLRRENSRTRSTNRTKKIKLAQQTRRQNIAISYAQYFLKEAGLLTLYYDAVCKASTVSQASNSKSESSSSSASDSSSNSADIRPIFSGFKIGDGIKLKNLTRIRSSGRIADETLLGEQATNAIGKIIAGPLKSIDSYGSITWWQVDFENGVNGWCGENNYLLYEAAPATPIPNLNPTPVTGPVDASVQMIKSGNNLVYSNPSYNSGRQIVFGNNILNTQTSQILIGGASPGDPIEKSNYLIHNTRIDGYGGNPFGRCFRSGNCPGSIIDPEALLMIWSNTRDPVYRNVLLKNLEIKNAAVYNPGPHVDLLQMYIPASPANQYLLDSQEWFAIQDSVLKNTDHNTMIMSGSNFKGFLYQNLVVAGALDAGFISDCLERLKYNQGPHCFGNTSIYAGYTWTSAPQTIWMVDVVSNSGSNAVAVDTYLGSKDPSLMGPVILVGEQTRNFRVDTFYWVNNTWERGVKNGPEQKVYRYRTVEEALAQHPRPPFIELSCAGWQTPPAGCTTGIGPKF